MEFYLISRLETENKVYYSQREVFIKQFGEGRTSSILYHEVQSCSM